MDNNLNLSKRLASLKDDMIEFPVSWSIVFINVIVFFSSYFYFRYFPDSRIGLFSGELVQQGGLYRFISATFMHANLIHLLVNCIAILCVARPLEYHLGKAQFAFFYVLFGIGSYLSVYLFSFESIAVGASGALFGLIGFYLATALGKDSYIDDRSKKMLILNLFLQIIPAVLFYEYISHAAHIGGLVTGFIIGLLTITFQKHKDSSNRTEGLYD